MKVISLSLLTILMISLAPSFPIWADLQESPPDIAYKPLKGIKKLTLLIESLPPDAAKIGLTKYRVSSITELKLRREGLLMSEEERQRSILSPNLYVNINVVNNAFAISIELREVVSLARDSSIICTAVIWDKGTLGVCGNSPDYIVSALSRLLDYFLNDYYKANPKG